MRRSGAVYGHSNGSRPGEKQYYRRVFSASGWDQWLRGHVIGRVLHVCCGASRVGDVRVDIDAGVPGVLVVADMLALPFVDAAFDTACCDPMYDLSMPQRVHLQRELVRVAGRRVLFKGPWIPRASGWNLIETTLLASHTCANVAVFSQLDRIQHGDLPLEGA